MTTRQYSSRSQQTTLTGAITSGTTSITVVSGSALLGGVSIPAGRTFTLVIDPDTALEEIVDATATSGVNGFIITRAIDGSSAQDHSAGAVVRHMAIGRDYRDANLHAEASTYYNDGSGTGHTLHGISSGEGDVVGTAKAQTLTNKTLTTPTIAGATVTGTVTTSATVNLTGNIVVSGSGTITGLSSAGMVASSATPKDYVDSILGSATSAATSAASAATSATSAATSATSAANSATAASTSATSASNFANAASTSASSASTSATSAAASATSAAASVTSATASATAAATSASSAATSATSSATNATAAATSASSAATSATSAAASAALLSDSSIQISFQVFG